MLGSIGHFFDGQKRQKRQRDSGFGVDFTHFCFSVSDVTLFLENHSMFSHEVFYSCSWYNIGTQYTLTMPLVYLGLCWGMYLLFTISVHYFVMKVCLHVSIMSPSWGGHFRVFWGLFSNITSTFWEPFNMFSWNFLHTFLGGFFFIALHYVFHIPTLLGSFTVERSVGRYFWAHLGKRLPNTSKLFNIFSWNFLQVLLI